jgi:hypothetical protein
MLYVVLKEYDSIKDYYVMYYIGLKRTINFFVKVNIFLIYQNLREENIIKVTLWITLKQIYF